MINQRLAEQMVRKTQSNIKNKVQKFILRFQGGTKK